MANDDSGVHVGNGSTGFHGPDGVNLYRATALASGLRLYAATGMKPNRMWTPSNMLRAAGQLTGKAYKRGAYVEAADDLKRWADTMKSALPITKE